MPPPLPPPLNFGPSVQYFNEFLKKDYMLFVFIVIQNEKVFFFCKIKWLVVIPRPALHEPFVQDEVCVSCRHFQYSNAGI